MTPSAPAINAFAINPHDDDPDNSAPSPPDVYRERIEALNAKSAAWSEARRVQRERMKETVA